MDMYTMVQAYGRKLTEIEKECQREGAVTYLIKSRFERAITDYFCFGEPAGLSSSAIPTNLSFVATFEELKPYHHYPAGKISWLHPNPKSKVKRLVPGLEIGSRVLAPFDTESSRSLISKNFAKAMNLPIEERNFASKSKIKKGVPGFVNGSSVSALPDTGSSRNVISQGFAKAMSLPIEGSPEEFLLGNSKRTKSLGEWTSRHLL